MLFWLVILGAWMGWVETVYGGNPKSLPPRLPDAYDWYAPLPEPPKHLQRLPVLEPDDTPEMCDAFIRYTGSRR